MQQLAELEEMELEQARKARKIVADREFGLSRGASTAELSTPRDAVIRRAKSSNTLTSAASSQSLSLPSASASSSSSKPGFKDDHPPNPPTVDQARKL